jgi:DNA-binding response OmpR family regulator
MMPGIDGMQVCKYLREHSKTIGIIMLSAKGESNDKIEGLNLGADDYLSKPFNTNELIARINALTRRKAEFTGDNLTFEDLTLDRSSLKLSCNHHSIVLGKKEFQILEMLILNKGKSVDKEKLIEKIWGYDTNAEYNTIEVYVSFLRKKFVAVGAQTEIKSIRGLGYTLTEK